MKKLKMWILNKLIRHMFKGLTEKDVLKVYGGKLFKGGEAVGKDLALGYRDQAVKMLEMEVWKEVKKQVELDANRLMFEKSKTVDDLFFGKAMLYNLDLIEQYLKLLTTVKN